MQVNVHADDTRKPKDCLPTSQINRGEYILPIHYLEIVTQEVDAVAAVYATANGLESNNSNPRLGSRKEEWLGYVRR